MATITFTIPDNKLQAIKDAFTAKYPQQGVVLGEDPPYSEAEWVRIKIKDYIKEIVQAHQTDLAIQNVSVPIDDDLVE